MSKVLYPPSLTSVSFCSSQYLKYNFYVANEIYLILIFSLNSRYTFLDNLLEIATEMSHRHFKAMLWGATSFLCRELWQNFIL